MTHALDLASEARTEKWRAAFKDRRLLETEEASVGRVVVNCSRPPMPLGILSPEPNATFKLVVGVQELPS